jgi:DNA-directed RNA polymerase sigma subunit (sigma70/sigma32)
MEKPTATKVRPGQAELALHLLDLTREESDRAKRNRKYYAGLARDHGLTFQQIGDKLGLTEGAVRAIIAQDA